VNSRTGLFSAASLIVLSLSLLACSEDDSPSGPANDPPVACFTVDPATVCAEAPCIFDARCSHDAEDSTAVLSVRWDWENDGIWDTEWSASQCDTHSFTAQGMPIVRLEVRDSGGLTGTIADTIAVGAAEHPPTACFSVNVAQAPLEFPFAFDASCSTDEEDPADSLCVRWDWEDDGAWDTAWSTNKAASHAYAMFGRKTVRMEARDTDGGTSFALHSLEVLIDYLGQAPPGLTPTLLAPTWLRATQTWTWHSSPAFAPNRGEMVFCKYHHTEPEYPELVMLTYKDDQWSAPQRAPFGDITVFENDPWYSVTGDTLFYETPRFGGFIAFVTRTAAGWSEPVPLELPIPAGASPGLTISCSRNGNLYGQLWEDGDCDIYLWRRLGGGYAEPERLPETVNGTDNDFSPCIDPEGRFLVFCSQRPGGFGRTDIYISRNEAGAWGEAVNLGSAVNTIHDDVAPRISPDGRYFIFCSPRAPGTWGIEPLWVDVHFLDGF